MADQQVGNILGVAANGNQPTLLSAITADGANTVTISDLSRIVVGMFVDIVTKASGAVVATNRQITNLTSAGVATYSGGDITASAAEGIYPVGGWAPTGVANLNGGTLPSNGFDLDDADTIATLKTKLFALDATSYSQARLATMTENDMVYALRLLLAPATVR